MEQTEFVARVYIKRKSTRMTATDVAPDRAPPVTTMIGKPELVLKSSEFRKGREAGWRELEGLIARVERRPPEQGDLRALAGRGRVVRHLRQRAVQPQHAGRHLDVRARHGGRHPDLAAVGLPGPAARRLHRAALQPRPDRRLSRLARHP